MFTYKTTNTTETVSLIKEQQKGFESNVSMFCEKNRLATFKTWPFGNDKPCNAINMAEAGFMCTGNAHELDVKCFLCKKSLDGWEETDNPWKEHLKHSGTCEFAQFGKPEICLTVDEIIELKKIMINNEFKNHLIVINEIYSEQKYIKENNIKKSLMSKKC